MMGEVHLGVQRANGVYAEWGLYLLANDFRKRGGVGRGETKKLWQERVGGRCEGRVVVMV
jgi:hypothetical protein